MYFGSLIIMYKRFILFIALLSFSFFSFTVQASEFKNGFHAFTSGNYEQALRLWLPFAEKDDADAQFNLGVLYMKGLGVEQNMKTAFIWYKRASANGHIDAMFNLGTMYNKGNAVARSPKDANKWWLKAAELGNDAAQFNIAVEYAYGNSLEKNIDEAIRWWEKSARQGNKDARAALYKVYTEGLFEIEIDQKEAKLWK